MKFSIIDHTGDTVCYIDETHDANKFLAEMLKTHMAYDADTKTVIREVTPETRAVIMHRHIVGG